jgi:radical SAM superfamily enzyme YgiQ (UPF0313 family)
MGTESLSLEAVSAVLKQHGHQTALAFDPSLFDDANYFTLPRLHKIFDDRHRLINKVISEKPDIVGFSVLTDTFRWAVSVARDIKKRLDVPIIFGGIFPTASPDYIISQDCVDMIVVGEGEYPMLELLNSMQAGRIDYGIKNVWFKKDGTIIKNPVRPLVDLEKLPLLDKELFENEVEMDRMYMTMTMKGCPFNCSYCSQNFMNHFNNGQDSRRRSVDSVINELVAAKKKYHYREVGIYDSVFTVNKKWIMEFLKRYKDEVGVTLRAISHPLCIDEEIAVALKEARCFRVQLGIQTFNEKIRREILLRNETNEGIKRCFKILDDVGLDYSCDHMFGLPGDTEEDEIAAARIYSRLKNRVRVTCFWTVFFPGTDLVAIAKKRGELDDAKITKINEGKQAAYIAGQHGSVENRELIWRNKAYEILFRSIPIMPPRLTNFILDHKIQRAFSYLPKVPVLFVVDLIVCFAKRDLSGFQYMGFYFLHFIKRIKRLFGLEK